VSPHYGTLGGVRLIIDRLAAAARAAGHDVGAVVDASADAFAGPASTLVLYPFPPRARDLRRLERFARKFAPAAARLAAAVRRFAPDVVSVHCVRRFAPYTALVRRLTGVPQVLNLQEGNLPSGTPDNPALFRMLVRSAAAVAACSEEAAACARRGGARRVVVVPNGYDPQELRAAAPFPHPRRYVLGVGRLERQKGFDVLIDAFARVSSPDVDVLLAGDGSERPALGRLAEDRGVAARVRFLGMTDRRTTASLLAGAAVVACPSRFEGMPLVCVEALAVGRPVVASAVNGIPEVVRPDDTGCLVPSDDPSALAAALERLLADPAAAETLAARGRRLVERRHDWSSVTSCYLDLCGQVAQEAVAPVAA